MTISTEKSPRVTEAIETRITTRAFLDKPVPKDVLKTIFETAQRAPSGGNLQPWNVHVFTGEKLETFRADIMGKLMKQEFEQETFKAYPSPLWEPLRTWRYELGEEMYRLLDIPKDNKPARMMQVAKNFTFFGAPVGIIVTGDKQLGMPQYMDIGIYLQTLMLLAREHGLHTAPQGAWRGWPDSIRAFTNHPEEQHVLVGMSMGYADPDQPVNDLESYRAPLDELVHFYD
jgi:nitroreductase